MYLYYFERIVRALMPTVGGPTDWALPYWSYSRGDDTARSLPPAFRETSLPDGSPNPLLVTDRNPGVNSGAMPAQNAVMFNVAMALPNLLAASRQH
jgi:hypothetical protein